MTMVSPLTSSAGQIFSIMDLVLASLPCFFHGKGFRLICISFISFSPPPGSSAWDELQSSMVIKVADYVILQR